MWKKLTITGILGTLAYVLHVVLGGFLWKGYSHLMQPISDLTGQGAPDRLFLLNITRIYELFSLAFAISAYMVLRGFAPKIAKVGMILFFAMHVVSVLYGIFPEDLAGSKPTFTGMMHFVITGLIVPLTVLSILFVGLGMKKIEEHKRYGVYSIITSIIIFCVGGFTVIILANKLSYFGLFERINIGSLQLWMAVTSWLLFKNKDNGKGYIIQNVRCQKSFN